MCIIGSNEPKYCACLYANNVLYMYNCIHEKAIKPSCILLNILHTMMVQMKQLSLYYSTSRKTESTHCTGKR